MENGTNLAKKTTLKIGKGVLLKILEEDFISESGNMSIGTKVEKKYLKGFYIGKNYFDVNEGDEIIGPEFAGDQNIGKKKFDLFAYKDNNHNIHVTYRISNLEIIPKQKLDVKDFPIEFFYSSLKIKYMNEYLKERIKNWENKQNLFRK